ncbi:MAG: hypothetical protein OEU26_07425 [Candidatus Tectomicrobia bacterium]|nr:hypothetical protein [Candidatus Tectomicrobia bacterium]
MRTCRHAGGSALSCAHIVQRCRRDIHAAAQHVMVNDSAYENDGPFMLDLPDANPTG